MVFEMLHFDCKRGLKRAKKALLSPFNKPLKPDTQRSPSPSHSPPNSTLQTSTSNNNIDIHNTNSNSDDNSDNNSNSNSKNNNNNARKVGGYLLCCLCMSKKAQSLDISSDGIDPNDPNVSFGSLKTLLENNDFYSEECNTHILP